MIEEEAHASQFRRRCFDLRSAARSVQYAPSTFTIHHVHHVGHLHVHHRHSRHKLGKGRKGRRPGPVIKYDRVQAAKCGGVEEQEKGGGTARAHTCGPSPHFALPTHHQGQFYKTQSANQTKTNVATQGAAAGKVASSASWCHDKKEKNARACECVGGLIEEK